MVDNLRLNKFAKVVCSKICKMCKDPVPSFCYSIALADTDRFIEIMKHILMYHNLKTTFRPKELKTFPGFSRLFCNFYRECPMKSEDCEVLDNMVYCYNIYMGQEEGKELNITQKSNIYSIFSGIRAQDIGKNIPMKMTPFEGMKKKRKKKLERLLESIRRATKEGKSKKETKTVRKPKGIVTTSWFWNDNDDEWRNWILERLDNATNNRQLDNAAGDTAAVNGLAGSTTDN